MMDSNIHSNPVRLNDLLDDLIADHGTLRVLRALALRIMSGRTRRPQVDHLSDHLRRDVGLPPSHPPPDLEGPRFW
ncbi:hypothetical protein [Aliiroseovarius sp. F20344]|uniref:hypothetical protein n=1 Tax=Aliiroseovarius sp. F20344 TaxID=2926414 RepID=UPI001FF3F6E7|nr:hypothetical protein [Aliiroseovarius sp. F20344]MCK0142615.1 hypothetical protein [Aliiroseovarius sp. F20344]